MCVQFANGNLQSGVYNMARFDVYSNEQLEVQVDKPLHCWDIKELWEVESPRLSFFAAGSQ